MNGWHVARQWAAGRLQPIGVKMAAMFKRLVIWRSDFLFFGTRSLVNG